MRALALALLLAPAAASAEPFGPWGTPGHPVTDDAVFAPRLPRVPVDRVIVVEPQRLAARPSARPPRPSSFDAHPLGLTFALYRDVLTKVDGPRCAHRPVCSVYARDAVARHGLLGFGLGIDRLFRRGLDSPLRRLPRLAYEDGTIALHDPLEFSTFFLEDGP